MRHRLLRLMVPIATLAIVTACSAVPASSPASGTAAPRASELSSPPNPADQLPMVACAALRHPIYEAINPTTGRTLLTASQKEAQNATRYGFTQQRGEVMRAATVGDVPGLVAIHRMSLSSTFAWVSEDRVNSMIASGFTDEGANFYASPTAAPCTKPVTELIRKDVRRYAATETEYKELTSDGWVDRGVAFHVAADPRSYSKPTTVGDIELRDPDPGDKQFTFAAIPDTQIEVHSASDTRFANRSQWLIDQRKDLDLRFAVQVGDLVDWDTSDHLQYRVAQQGLDLLTAAKFPYFLNIGNHDGQAVCPGGAACDARFTRQLVRMTDVFNEFFRPEQFGVKVGEFEPGKIDNTYSTVGAGGVKWLVLNLEIWPRESVLDWAARLIETHPNHNVILTTHAFLNSANQIDNEPNYGGSTSQHLYDRLVEPYHNVKIILCGHVGFGGSAKAFRRADGTKVVALMQAYHSQTTNPVRLVEVNTAKDTITSWVTAPATSQDLQRPETFSKIGIIGGG